MQISYTKTCTLPAQLIPILKGRGLAFEDEKQAENYLTHIGYFRLSAYLRPLYEHPRSRQVFKQDATFERAMEMYRFDRKLRIMLFNEIEKIEVAIRAELTNYMSHEVNNVFWMTESQYFHREVSFQSTKAIIDTELSRTKEDFIIEFKRYYNDPYPPSWMIAEILPLGVLCNIYRNLKQMKWKKEIAGKFGLSTKAFDSWIQVLGMLRNLCGHHSRLWNRIMSISPAIPTNTPYQWIDMTKTDTRRVYCRICVIKYFLITISPHNNFKQKIKSLIAYWIYR